MWKFNSPIESFACSNPTSPTTCKRLYANYSWGHAVHPTSTFPPLLKILSIVHCVKMISKSKWTNDKQAVDQDAVLSFLDCARRGVDQSQWLIRSIAKTSIGSWAPVGESGCPGQKLRHKSMAGQSELGALQLTMKNGAIKIPRP